MTGLNRGRIALPLEGEVKGSYFPPVRKVTIRSLSDLSAVLMA
jgi:hypothetical protein